MSQPREHEQRYGPQHPAIMQEFYELQELYEREELNDEEFEGLRLRLQAMIEQDPDYLDPYLLLVKVYDQDLDYETMILPGARLRPSAFISSSELVPDLRNRPRRR